MDEEKQEAPIRFVRRSRLTPERMAVREAKVAEIERTRRTIWTPDRIDIPEGVQHPENGIASVAFEEFVSNEIKDFSRIGNSTESQFTPLQFITKIFSDDTPFLYAGFEPAIDINGRALGRRNYGIGDSTVEDIFLDQDSIAPGAVDVYNVSLTELSNPNYVGEIAIYTARNLLVPTNQEAADQINSWVADPEFRARIEEYSGRAIEVLHLIKLRQAILGPGRTEVVPDQRKPAESFFVTYDYDGIKEAVEKRGGDGKFTKEDVEWLEEHIRAKGVSPA